MHMQKPLICAALLIFSSGALADEPKAAGEQDLDLSAILSAMGGNVPMAAALPKAGLPDFKEVTKDLVLKQGLFRICY